MAELAAPNDVAVELGLEDASGWDTAKTSRVASLLIKASYIFRQSAERQFTAADYTHRLQVINGRVRLLESPVTAVESVADDSGNDVNFTRNGDVLDVSGHHNTNASFSCYRPDDLRSGWFVTVTYSGGGVPDVVRVTVAQIVARQMNIDPTAATGVKSEEQTMGPFTERKQFFDWAVETIRLTDEERAIAESFRYAGTAPIIHRSC